MGRSPPCRLANKDMEKAKQKELQLFCGGIMEDFDEAIEEAIMEGKLNEPGGCGGYYGMWETIMG